LGGDQKVILKESVNGVAESVKLTESISLARGHMARSMIDREH